MSRKLCSLFPSLTAMLLTTRRNILHIKFHSSSPVAYYNHPSLLFRTLKNFRKTFTRYSSKKIIFCKYSRWTIGPRFFSCFCWFYKIDFYNVLWRYDHFIFHKVTNPLTFEFDVIDVFPVNVQNISSLSFAYLWFYGELRCFINRVGHKNIYVVIQTLLWMVGFRF